MSADLNSLRIDPNDRAHHGEKSRWPLVLLVLLLGGGAGAVAWQFRGKPAVAVQTIRVRLPEGFASPSDAVALQATGYVMAAHKIELASKAIGRVAWVGVEMGDKIKKGQELVRLEDDEYRARVTQQEGQLDAAKAKLAELQAGSRPQEIAVSAAALAKSMAELSVAKTTLKRLADLEKTKAVTRQQIDDAEALVSARQAQVDADQQSLDLAKTGPREEVIAAQKGVVRQLEGGLALAKVDLDNTIIRSPVDATVLARNVEVGEFVTTGFVGENGAKGYVLSIADLSDLRVDLDISQNDFAKVKRQQACTIVTDAYPDRRYAGVVDLISPEANRQKATVQVRVKVLNPDELLKPDMNATVSFLNQSRAATRPAADRPLLRIPATAVRTDAVFVVENGKAVKKNVTAGGTQAGQTEIRDGLIGGEDLITNPPADLQPGDAVTPTDVSEAKP